MSKFFIPMISGFLRLSLALLLAGCAFIAPSSGMGAIFATPEEAFVDALESGWLGQASELVLHEQIDTSEGVVALYSGYGASKALKLGIADVKPKAWGWYAHGRFSLSTPPLAKSERLSCAIALLPSSGEEFLIVSGHLRASPNSPNNGRAIESIEGIEITFDSGLRKEAVIRDDTFAAITNKATAIVRVLALNENGQVVRELEPAACFTGGRRDE